MPRRAAGWQCEEVALGTTLPQRLRAFRKAAAADVVVLLRKLLPIWQLLLLRKQAKSLVFDLDDAVYLRDSNASKPAYSRLRLGRYWATLEAADLVTCGNQHLVETAAAYTRGAKVQHCPTCVDPQRYPLAAHRNTGSDCRLVWIGSRATLPSLHDAREQLAEATRALPGLKLVAICDRSALALPILVQPRGWSAATEARDLAAADIGLAWLPEHPFSDGKCGLKVLQYMAAGLPVVANPGGVHSAIVRHGETGWLVRTPGEFAAAVSRLAADPELRRRMGQAGRQRVERHYSVSSWDPHVAASLDAAAQHIRPEAPPSLLPSFETKRDRSCATVA